MNGCSGPWAQSRWLGCHSVYGSISSTHIIMHMQLMNLLTVHTEHTTFTGTQLKELHGVSKQNSFEKVTQNTDLAKTFLSKVTCMMYVFHFPKVESYYHAIAT